MARKKISKLSFLIFLLVSSVAMTATTLLFIEFCLRVFFHKSKDLHMEMFKYAKYAKVKTDSALPGHKNRPSTKINLMGAEVTILKDGNRKTISPPRRSPQAKEFKVLFLGDSFTFGWGVNDIGTIPSQFTKLANASKDKCARKIYFTSTNTGVGNYNSRQQFELLQGILRQANPDLLVLLHFINDAEPYNPVASNLLQRNSYLFNFISGRIAAKQSLTYYDFYNNIYNNPGWNGNKEALIGIRSLTKTATGQDAMVFLLPELREMKPNSRLEFAYLKREGFFKQNLFTYFDTKNFLFRLANGAPESLWVTKEDSHSNEFANNAIASYIANKVISSRAVQDLCTEYISTKH